MNMYIAFRNTGLGNHPEIRKTAEDASRVGLTQANLLIPRSVYQSPIDINSTGSINQDNKTEIRELTDCCRRLDTTQTSYTIN